MSRLQTSILEHGLSNLNLQDASINSEQNAPSNGNTDSSAGPSASLALAGMEDVLETLREVIAWPVLYAKQAAELGVRFPKGILLHGPSGVGKSTAVAAIAKECNASLHLITPSSIFGAFTGESERRLRDAYAAAEKDARTTGRPAIVFLDEVDALCPKRTAHSQHEARVVGQLLTLLDGAASGSHRTSSTVAVNNTSSSSNTSNNTFNDILEGGYVVTVAATSRPNAIDPALRRPGRLDREVAVGIPSPKARVEILKLVAGGMPLADDVDLETIAESCYGYTGADLVSLCREAAMRAIVAMTKPFIDQQQENMKIPTKQKQPISSTATLEDVLKTQPPKLVTAADFESAREKVGASVARTVSREYSPATWDDIGGCDEAKKQLQQAVEWPITRKEAFQRLGLKAPRGVLLHGPPGCAKTTLARAAVTACGATFIPLAGSELYSMYVGEGEAKLREAFNKARLAAPSIVFIDEIDAVVGKRPSGSGAAQELDISSRLLSSFLTEMDGLELATGILVLATTNRPQALDPALLRPGRFDRIVFVGPPDVQGRFAALRVHTKKMPLAEDVNLERIAELTEMYTGAELAGVCREAALCAVRDIEHEQQPGQQQQQPTREADDSLETLKNDNSRGENLDYAAMRSVDCVAMRHFEAAVRGIRAGLTRELLQQYENWPSEGLL